MSSSKTTTISVPVRESTFWKHEPIMQKFNPNTSYNNIFTSTLDPTQTLPYELPSNLTWGILDINSSEDMRQMTVLLNINYSESKGGNKYKKVYTENYIKWLFTQCQKYIILGVRNAQSNALMGVISCRIQTMQLNKNTLDIANTSFLCVHSTQKKSQLAIVLIKELKRLVSTNYNIQVGLFCTKTSIHATPLCEYITYARPLSISKLYRLKYITLHEKANISTLEKHYNHGLDQKPNNNFVRLCELTLNQAFEAYNISTSRYNLYHKYTLDEFKNIFLSNPYIISYIYLDPDTSEPELLSIYTSTYTHSKNLITRGEIYYYTANVQTPYFMVKQALLLCCQHNIDVVHITNMMDNFEVISELRFDEIDKPTNLYIYNWKSITLMPKQIYFPDIE